MLVERCEMPVKTHPKDRRRHDIPDAFENDYWESTRTGSFAIRFF